MKALKSFFTVALALICTVKEKGFEKNLFKKAGR